MAYAYFTGHCLSCEHWRGDKKKVWGLIDHYGTIVMDMTNGWAPSGRCNIDVEWIDIESTNGAAVVVKTNASFGCNYYDKEKGL